MVDCRKLVLVQKREHLPISASFLSVTGVILVLRCTVNLKCIALSGAFMLNGISTHNFKREHFLEDIYPEEYSQSYTGGLFNARSVTEFIFRDI